MTRGKGASLPTASSSSMKTTQGARLRASANRSRTRAAPLPTNSSTNSEAAAAKKGTPASPATALAAPHVSSQYILPCGTMIWPELLWVLCWPSSREWSAWIILSHEFCSCSMAFRWQKVAFWVSNTPSKLKKAISATKLTEKERTEAEIDLEEERRYEKHGLTKQSFTGAWWSTEEDSRGHAGIEACIPRGILEALNDFKQFCLGAVCPSYILECDWRSLSAFATLVLVPVTTPCHKSLIMSKQAAVPLISWQASVPAGLNLALAKIRQEVLAQNPVWWSSARIWGCMHGNFL